MFFFGSCDQNKQNNPTLDFFFQAKKKTSKNKQNKTNKKSITKNLKTSTSFSTIIIVILFLFHFVSDLFYSFYFVSKFDSTSPPFFFFFLVLISVSATQAQMTAKLCFKDYQNSWNVELEGKKNSINRPENFIEKSFLKKSKTSNFIHFLVLLCILKTISKVFSFLSVLCQKIQSFILFFYCPYFFVSLLWNHF